MENAPKFVEFARTIAKNAPAYRSIAACRAMATKLAGAYFKSGSLGVVDGYRKEALAAIQDRACELRAIEIDARIADEQLAEEDGVEPGVDDERNELWHALQIARRGDAA